MELIWSGNKTRTMYVVFFSLQNSIFEIKYVDFLILTVFFVNHRLKTQLLVLKRPTTIWKKTLEMSSFDCEKNRENASFRQNANVKLIHKNIMKIGVYLKRTKKITTKNHISSQQLTIDLTRNKILWLSLIIMRQRIQWKYLEMSTINL